MPPRRSRAVNQHSGGFVVAMGRVVASSLSGELCTGDSGFDTAVLCDSFGTFRTAGEPCTSDRVCPTALFAGTACARLNRFRFLRCSAFDASGGDLEFSRSVHLLAPLVWLGCIGLFRSERLVEVRLENPSLPSVLSFKFVALICPAC